MSRSRRGRRRRRIPVLTVSAGASRPGGLPVANLPESVGGGRAQGDAPAGTVLASRMATRDRRHQYAWHIVGPDHTAACDNRLRLSTTYDRPATQTMPRLRCRRRPCAAAFAAALEAPEAAAA